MKASVVTAYGGPEVMKYQDMPDPKPGAGDVLVKVAGIGINPEDMLERNGDLKDRWPLQFPAIIGLDVSGTVVATGDGVTDLKVGERSARGRTTRTLNWSPTKRLFSPRCRRRWTWSTRPRFRSWASREAN